MAQGGIPACSKFKIQINPEEDYCSWHENKEAAKCAYCDSTESLILHYINDDDYILTCPTHSQYMYTCATCKYVDECGFNNDTSGEPKVVSQRIQQGFMVIQQQVKNPNLIARHCSVCRCSIKDSNNTCLKDSNGVGCANWSYNNS